MTLNLTSQTSLQPAWGSTSTRSQTHTQKNCLSVSDAIRIKEQSWSRHQNCSSDRLILEFSLVQILMKEVDPKLGRRLFIFRLKGKTRGSQEEQSFKRAGRKEMPLVLYLQNQKYCCPALCLENKLVYFESDFIK